MVKNEIYDVRLNIGVHVTKLVLNVILYKFIILLYVRLFLQNCVYQKFIINNDLYINVFMYIKKFLLNINLLNNEILNNNQLDIELP